MEISSFKATSRPLAAMKKVLTLPITIESELKIKGLNMKSNQESDNEMQPQKKSSKTHKTTEGGAWAKHSITGIQQIRNWVTSYQGSLFMAHSSNQPMCSLDKAPAATLGTTSQNWIVSL